MANKTNKTDVLNEYKERCTNKVRNKRKKIMKIKKTLPINSYSRNIYINTNKIYEIKKGMN